VGRVLAPRSIRQRSPGEVSSGPIALRVFAGARIQLGGLTVRKDIDIFTGAPEIECPVDGVIGLDVLRSCVLVFGSEKGQLRMQCNGESSKH
jgi:arginine/ornithine N-succinyltransferase beta subunit